MATVSAILLGAGLSRRMGVNKLLLPWGKKTIFQQCFSTIMRSDVAEVIVVLGRRTRGLQDRITAGDFSGRTRSMKDQRAFKVAVHLPQRALKVRKKRLPAVKVILNPTSKGGMSRSIRLGVRAVDPGSSGILIALGDMPSLKERTINRLIETFKKRGGIIMPSFNGRRGHPAIFHKKYKREMLGLAGDAGARSIVANHPGDVTFVKVRSRGVVQDVDTWSDYEDHMESGLAHGE